MWIIRKFYYLYNLSINLKLYPNQKFIKITKLIPTLKGSVEFRILEDFFYNFYTSKNPGKNISLVSFQLKNDKQE